MSIASPQPTGTPASGHVMRIVCLVLAGLALAAAVVIAVLPLSKPATLKISGVEVTGGTCGPGKGSESAIEAFFDPASIGAGAAASGSSVEAGIENVGRLAFIGQCQSATNGRMVDALALLIVAGFFGLVAPPLVRRAWHEPLVAASSRPAPPGWYADPELQGSWRWWDGHSWGQRAEPPPAT